MADHSFDFATLNPNRPPLEKYSENNETLNSEAGHFGNMNDFNEQKADVDSEKVRGLATNARDSARKWSNAQDWNGSDDPENPMNWQPWKRWYQIVIVSLLCFSVTAGSSMITPATLEIEEHFHVSQTASILSLSLFVLGLAMGPLIAAPLSEAFGRVVVYKVMAPVYLLFILGAGFSKSLGGFLVCRLLAGVAGSPPLAIGAGTVADLTPQHLRAAASSMFIMAPFLGPALGPVIGGFAAQFKGYKWTQWCTIFVGLAVYVFVLPMQETYKKVILKRRAHKLNLMPPAQPKANIWGTIKTMLTTTLFRPLSMLVLEPIVMLLSLYTAFCFSVMFAFFAAYPLVFESVYGFNTWQYGLTFLGIGTGVVLAAMGALVIDQTVYKSKYLEAVEHGKTSVAPEHRLYSAMLGAFSVSIGLFWFAWTSRASVHWISPTLAGIPFGVGNFSIFVSATLYLMDVYGPLGGASAMAANGLLRYTMGAAFPLFTVQMYERLGIAWATTLLGFISLAMLPIPFVFFRFGPAIREKSRYGRREPL